MRICQQNVDGVKACGILQFAPVGCNHVGGGFDPGCAAKLSHDLPAGEAVLSSAGIFGVREHVLLSIAQSNSFLERPRAVGINRDSGLREPLCQRSHHLHLELSGIHAALQLEISESITLPCSFGKIEHGLNGEGLFVAQSEPCVVSVRFAAIRKIRSRSIADEEEISKHIDSLPPQAVSQKHRYGHLEELSKQIEQG